MRLEQYRTVWGILNKTDGQLAKAPFQVTFFIFMDTLYFTKHFAKPYSFNSLCTTFEIMFKLLEEVVPKLKELGYQGIEIPWKLVLSENKRKKDSNFVKDLLR